eukprot:TRINITY_DN20140_c0_g1_i1.p1 TRINITY_DN20140_c0_g1~~TRINITY_DN20140_c0_g1_i1.p1  ORF type:complete len:264 (+),score=63.23 TRINITY_DN20140_c0_g1_i1:124-915(+)
MADVSDFAKGTHAQITGLAAKPELNDEYCVSLGVSPENAERVTVVTKSGAKLALRPANLNAAELLPGSRVCMVGLQGAAQYNGQFGEVLSWDKERWIVDLDSKERKSFRAENLVIVPRAVASRKRPAEEPQVDAKRVKRDELRELESNDEQRIGRALYKLLQEYPVLAQKCVCVLATKQTVTVMHELAQHITDKQGDGHLRRALRPGEKVRGIEELDAMEQCHVIASKRARALANMVRINYCDLLGFIKQGMEEPKFRKREAS